jgi:hypothetical protein
MGMTDERFDDLTRRLESATSRRGVLKGAAAVALGGLATRLRGSRAEARARIKLACAREGQACDPAQAALGRVVCCPGLVCDADSLVCAPPLPTCDPTGPREACADLIFASCAPGDACAQVTDVDGGGCTCIVRTCGPTCQTGADCESGLCVDVPGCCNEPGVFFCGTPCGSIPIPDGTGADVRVTGVTGWGD